MVGGCGSSGGRHGAGWIEVYDSACLPYVLMAWMAARLVSKLIENDGRATT